MQLMHVNKVFQIDNLEHFVIQRSLFCSDKQVGGYYAGKCQTSQKILARYLISQFLFPVSLRVPYLEFVVYLLD